MKIIAVIPARYASTRFPAKPLFKIKNKPLLQWVIEALQSSQQKNNLLSDIYVATDHSEIAALAEKCGVQALMTSEVCQTGSDRIYEACQQLKSSGYDFDVVINVQGDEPMISDTHIELLAKAFIENPKLDMATLAHPLSVEEIENKNAVKVVLNQKNEALYFSRYPIPFSRTGFTAKKFDTVVQKHIGLYGYQFSFLEKFCKADQSPLEVAESLEQLRALALGARIKVLSVETALIGVDTPEDAAKVAEFLKIKNI